VNPNFWQGEKVRLRALEPDDLEALPLQEPDTELDRYEDFIHFPTSRDRARETLERLGRPRGDDSFFWVIEAEGARVGSISTYDCDRRVGAFRYGLSIFRPYWGRGYAREAIKLVLRYYFRELRYQKVTVALHSFNGRSRRLHEGLGFTQEGRLRRTVYTNGAFYDELFFGMTCEEFDRLDPKLKL